MQTQTEPNVFVILMILSALRYYKEKMESATTMKIARIIPYFSKNTLQQLDLMHEWKWISTINKYGEILKSDSIPKDINGFPKKHSYIQLTDDQNKIAEIKQWMNQIMQEF